MGAYDEPAMWFRNRRANLRSGKSSLGREILESAGDVTEPLVDDVVSTVTFMVLAVLFVPIGLIVLVVSVLVFVGLSSVIGPPSGVLGQVIGITWLVLTLGALVLVFRTLYRRLPRRVRDHAVPGLRGQREPADVPAAAPRRNRDPAASPLPAPSLAELDARFTPRDPPSEVGAAPLDRAAPERRPYPGTLPSASAIA